MTKSADTFFLCDPWKITEEGWHRDRNLVSESVFSLGNEYMGVRGFFDEGLGICRDNGNRDGTDSNSPRTLRGLYFNGIYEIADLPKSYKGIVTKTHFMVNAVDWLYTEIRAGTDTLDLAVSEISGFRRVLDMKEGTLTRSFDWHTRSGQIIHLEFIRFLDMDNACRAYQRIACSALQGKIELTMVIANSFNTVHGWDRKNFWKVTRREWFERGAALLGEVLGSGQQVFSGFSLAVSAGAQLTKYESEKAAGFTVSLPLAAGTEAWIEKSVMNYAVKERPLARVHDQCSMPPEEQRGVPRHSSPEADTQPVWEKGMAELNRSRPGFEAARADNKKYWTAFWKNADIVIDGDPLNQQGIRFCIFQMHQTYHGYDPSNNIGAKGLTGEAYNGHTFWDTETYCLPFYLFSNLRAAKDLLEYRYTALNAARERAGQLDCRGACYPIATLNGEECCGLWQHASLQFQPGTAVAFGIAHYAKLSGDIDFLFGHGAEMLVEISRFLVSRGSWNTAGTGFGFYAVMGPDEFHMMVNHNCYTNFMAKKTFEYTEKTLRDMAEKSPERYSALCEKTGLDLAERDGFSCCAEKMIIPYSPETGLYEQHQGYFSLPHIDISGIPAEDFPLYDNWSYDRIYRTDMIKQPDVLMFMFLYNSEFSADIKLKNYEFYEPRTIHESSLSPSVHSILACELGKYSDAFRFFAFATRMDLDNYNRNSGEGLHTTSIAAAWMNIVYGFGGLRSDGPELALAPYLPESWNRYEFGILYRNTHIRIEVSASAVTLTAPDCIHGEIPVVIYGKKYCLDSTGLIIPMEKKHVQA